MKKLSETTEVQEIFKLNEELGKLLDCKLSLDDLDYFDIPYIDFKNGEYGDKAEIVHHLLDEESRLLNDQL